MINVINIFTNINTINSFIWPILSFFYHKFNITNIINLSVYGDLFFPPDNCVFLLVAWRTWQSPQDSCPQTQRLFSCWKILLGERKRQCLQAETLPYSSQCLPGSFLWVSLHYKRFGMVLYNNFKYQMLIRNEIKKNFPSNIWTWACNSDGNEFVRRGGGSRCMVRLYLRIYI